MAAEPIRHEYVVRCSPDHAFEVYARRTGDWWPATYSADPSTFRDVRIEGRAGGEVVEVHDDGTTYGWGQVTTWEPGHELAYTSTLAQRREHPSLITVTFGPDDAGCRVTFEHGGWDEVNGADRAKFGDWPLILAAFVELAERDQPGPDRS